MLHFEVAIGDSNMFPVASKIFHKVINAIPGVRYRLWMEYRCFRSSFKVQNSPTLTAEPFCIKAEELAFLKKLKPDAGPLAELAERLVLGNECWVAKIGDQWVYSQWAMVNHGDKPMALEKTARTPRGMRLPPRALYFWDAWCAPAWRNRGINRSVKSKIMEYYYAHDLEEAITLILPFNLPNRRSVASLGFQYRRLRLEMKLDAEHSERNDHG